MPAPDLKDLICPETGRAMQAAFVEVLEVLARKPAVYFVKRYERTVFTSPAKTAPVYGPWPQDVLPRSRVHASIVAHIAAMHFCEDQASPTTGWRNSWSGSGWTCRASAKSR